MKPDGDMVCFVAHTNDKMKCPRCRIPRFLMQFNKLSISPITKLRLRITVGFAARLLEVAVFFVFLISQDEQQQIKNEGVVDALNGLCMSAFVSTTIAFTVKYIQEMFFHHDTVLSLMIQGFLWIISIVSVVLFLIYFIVLIFSDAIPSPAPTHTTTVGNFFGTKYYLTPTSTPNPWTIFNNLSRRLQAKFIAFVVFSWQNWRRLPFLGRSKSAFVSVPLCFWSDETQSLIFSQAELPKAKQYYGSSAFQDDEQMEVDNDNDDDRLLTSKRKQKKIINDV